MHAYQNKVPESKGQSTANANSLSKSGGKSPFQFIDNRPEMIIQGNSHGVENNSNQSQRAAQLQSIADNYAAHQQTSLEKKKSKIREPENLVQRQAVNSIGSNVVQRVLVNRIGQNLSPSEIQDLRVKYPSDVQRINASAVSVQSFAVYENRAGLQINVYAPPSSGGFHYSLPPDHTTSAMSDDTNRMAARNEGMSLNLSREQFGSKFTEEMLESEHGPQYDGASKISGGMGLKPAGLDRTHHLSDSSIRVIIQWLNENRDWQGFGLNWVINWMRALTGNVGVQELLELMGTTQNPPSTSQLNTVVDRLSNNTHQVGFGDSFTNQRVVGPFFDSSKTSSGFDSPLAVSISLATEGLKNAGVPSSIIDAAIAEVIDQKTGQKKSSMTYTMPPRPDDYDPPFGGGGGFGGFGGGGKGGGMGGGSSSMVF